jgi:putative peptidoglycan lipid II flippase
MQAAAQWWGAYRVGVTLWPRVGWRNPEVRRIVSLAIPSGGYACLNGLNFFALLVVAGSVPGGAIALQIGLAFFNLPIALFARPVAAAQLPRLSRSFNRDDGPGFHTTYRNSLGLTMMLALPACLVFLGMPEILARAVAFGEMASPTGIALVAACVGSTGLGIVAEAAFVVSTSAAYARRDATAPFQAMVVRVGLSAAGMALAWFAMDGVAVLWTIGLSFSVANLIAATFLQQTTTRRLPPVAGYGAHQLLTDLAIAAAAVAPGTLVGHWLAGAWGEGLAIPVAMVAIGVSAIIYLAIQWARGSKELAAFMAGRRGTEPLDDDPDRPASRG